MDFSAAPLPAGDDGVRNPIKDHTYGFECRDTNGTVTRPMEIIVGYDPGNPLAPLGDMTPPNTLLQWIGTQVDTIGEPPALVTSPAADARQITGLKTWFWVGNTWEHRAPRQQAGGFTASVSVTPTRLTIDPGDGTKPIHCNRDEAVAWVEGAKDTRCGYVYHRRSTDPDAPGHRPPGVYRVTATLTYTASWGVWEGDPETGVLLDGGDLGTITSQPTSLDLRVHSVEAVIR